jgi:hypothetical protein
VHYIYNIHTSRSMIWTESAYLVGSIEASILVTTPRRWIPPVEGICTVHSWTCRICSLCKFLFVDQHLSILVVIIGTGLHQSPYILVLPGCCYLLTWPLRRRTQPRFGILVPLISFCLPYIAFGVREPAPRILNIEAFWSSHADVHCGARKLFNFSLENSKRCTQSVYPLHEKEAVFGTGMLQVILHPSGQRA